MISHCAFNLHLSMASDVFNNGPKAIRMTLQYIAIIICSSLLLVTIVNLLLGIIYKLNLLLLCMYRKKIVHIGFNAICGFRCPSRVLEWIPHR